MVSEARHSCLVLKSIHWTIHTDAMATVGNNCWCASLSTWCYNLLESKQAKQFNYQNVEANQKPHPDSASAPTLTHCFEILWNWECLKMWHTPKMPIVVVMQPSNIGAPYFQTNHDKPNYLFSLLTAAKGLSAANFRRWSKRLQSLPCLPWKAWKAARVWIWMNHRLWKHVKHF